MSSTNTAPTERRRGSARLEEKTRTAAATAAAAESKTNTPGPTAKPKTAPKKKETKKSTTTPSKSAEKRKLPTPEDDESTLVDDAEEGQSPTKNKPSPKVKKHASKTKLKGGCGGKKTAKKDTPTPRSTPPPAVQSAPPTASPSAAVSIDYQAISEQVTQAVHASILPYTKILDPFMQFQIQCAKLGYQTGLDAEAKRTEVIDIISKLQAQLDKKTVKRVIRVVEPVLEKTAKKSGGAGDTSVPATEEAIDDGFVDGMEDDAELDVGEEDDDLFHSDPMYVGLEEDESWRRIIPDDPDL